MKVVKTAVIVKLDNGNIHQVLLNKKQVEVINDLVLLTTPGGKLKLIDDVIKTIEIK